MALNAEFVGRTYEPCEVFEVTAERITEFANAIKTEPATIEVAGSSVLVAPPTMPIAFTLRAGEALGEDPELGLDWTRVVHGEQRFLYRRPIVAGDRLEISSTIENIRSAAGNDMITLRADVRTVDGEEVAQCWSLLVARGTA